MGGLLVDVLLDVLLDVGSTAAGGVQPKVTSPAQAIVDNANLKLSFRTVEFPLSSVKVLTRASKRTKLYELQPLKSNAQYGSHARVVCPF